MMKTYYWKLQEDGNNREIFSQAAALIKKGEVVAFPTETVYGLGADGLNGTAVAKIFAAKGRPADNPLILHIAEKKDIEVLAEEINANAKLLMEKFWPGPLTLVVRKSARIPDEVSAGLATVAVRMPSNKWANEFIRACGCPVAAPSANISGRPSPTNGRDVLEDMDGKIAAVLDGGGSGIGIESTVVDTTEPVPVILRPGGITYEMLLDVLGAVDIDPALHGDKNFRPKAPGMKYRHYAPKAPMYLFTEDAVCALPYIVDEALKAGMKPGILCSSGIAEQLDCGNEAVLASWGDGSASLATKLFYLLRDFDRGNADVIFAQGVEEEGLGLAVMNRMRKAAGNQVVVLENGALRLKNNAQLPEFMIKYRA